MLLKSLSLRSHAFSSSYASEVGTNPRWVPFKSSSFPCCSSNPRNLSRLLCLSSQSSSIRENSGEVGRGDAVIIVDHGSRRKESNLMLNEFVEMFKHKTGYEIVEPAHMVSASKVLQETCNYIRSLHREVDDLSERLSQLLTYVINYVGSHISWASFVSQTYPKK